MRRPASLALWLSCGLLSACGTVDPIRRPIVVGTTPASEARRARAAADEATPPSASAPTSARPTAERPPLIPRKVLFGNPDRAGVRMSHDGKNISWLSPVDGVMNIWVAPADDLAAAKAVTADKKRGITSYFWAYDNEHIVYLQDKDGDENTRAYALHVATLAVKDLTPFAETQARIEETSPEFPGELLVGLNDRDKRLHDLYRVSLTTGERTLVQLNEGYSGFGTDSKFRVRLAARVRPDGGVSYLKRADDGSFQPYLDVDHEDAQGTSPQGYDRAGEVLYLRESRGRDTSALYEMNLATGASRLLAEDPKADVGGALAHPATGRVQAVSFNYEKPHWKVLDTAVQGDLDVLERVDEGELLVLSRTLADDRWIVAFLRDDAPVRYHVYDRATKQARFLFTNRKDLEGLPLVRMFPVVIPSRDGLSLVSYLSLPHESDPTRSGRPGKPLPMVLDVHGGPWARDGWGYNPVHQWLANRGYAVLSVNFRGSTGFGKRFLNAANGEWAGKMHDDLLDAVDWAVKSGIADRTKVAISGGSYGGYATLVGLTFTPEVFACGVDVVGPSSLLTLLQSVPPYWKPQLAMMRKRVADETTEEGKRHLLERSPLTRVDRIQRPLLIGQGANDPRVKQHEADQIVKAMTEKGIPVTYVLYPDEGHGFQRPPNRLSFQAITEAFLAPILGGRAEPLGDDLEGSTLKVPVGADRIPGLPAALEALAR
jgi:dipeptidyl aminopeptidase/acylaminoacyl peptidase